MLPLLLAMFVAMLPVGNAAADPLGESLPEPPSLRHAHELSARGLHAEAMMVLEALVSEEPDSAEAWHLLGHVQAELGLLDRAQAALSRALAPGWGRREALLLFIDVARRRGRLGSVRPALELATMLWPEDRAVHLLLAEALAGEGRWEAAEEALDGISGPGPTNAEIPLRVGSFRLQAGRVREAVTELESAYYMGSSHPDLPRTVGEAWLEIGDPERARVWFERWTSSSRDERAVLDLRVIEVALAAGEHDLAQAEARRLLDREETTVEIRARVFLLLGRLSWIEGREDEATARFLEAIDEGFEDPAWDGFLGSLFQGAGNLERARLHLERRADREEEDSRSRALLVSVLARLGRLGEARDELISFVEREGWSVEAEALAREITGAKP